MGDEEQLKKLRDASAKIKSLGDQAVQQARVLRDKVVAQREVWGACFRGTI